MKDLIKKIRAVEPTKEQTKDRTPEYAFGWVDSLNAITKVVKNNIDLAIVMPSVIYLVTNEDKMTVESAHWKLEDAKKEVDDWAKHQPQFTFMVVETEIH